MITLRKALFSLGVALASLAAFAQSASAAPIVLEDFNAPTQVISGGPDPIGVSTSGPNPALGSFFGGTASSRLIGITRTGGTNQFSIGINSTPGLLTIGNGPGVTSNSFVSYGLNGLYEIDAGSTFFLNGVTNDVNNVTFTFSFYDGATLLDSVSQIVGPTAGTNLAFLITGGLNNISRIELTVSAPGGDSDIEADQITFDGGFRRQGDPEPEPATLATFGLMGLMGGFVARRKLKARAAAAQV